MIPGFSDRVVLIQSDTTVGLVSQDGARLNQIKGRPPCQPLIETVASLAVLKSSLRVPLAVRGAIRRLKRTTVAYPQGRALRLVSGDHARQLEGLGWCYSSSANPTGGGYDESWAKERADIWCLRPQGFKPRAASRILRLSRNGRFVKLR